MGHKWQKKKRKKIKTYRYIDSRRNEGDWVSGVSNYILLFRLKSSWVTAASQIFFKFNLESYIPVPNRFIAGATHQLQMHPLFLL